MESTCPVRRLARFVDAACRSHANVKSAALRSLGMSPERVRRWFVSIGMTLLGDVTDND